MTLLFLSKKITFAASQTKHLEAYELAASTGDMEFSCYNLFLYSTTAIYGSEENLETLSQNIQCVFSFCNPFSLKMASLIDSKYINRSSDI